MLDLLIKGVVIATGVVRRLLSPNDISRPIRVNGLIGGLSFYRGDLAISASDNATFMHQFGNGKKIYTESKMPYIGRGALHFVGDNTAYTVNLKKGEITKLTFDEESVVAKDIRKYNGFFTDLYKVEKSLYASSFQYTDGAPITTIWKLKKGKFINWFNFDGLVTKFVLGKSKKALFAITSTQNRDKIEKQLIKVNTPLGGRNQSPTAITIKQHHNAIARDERNIIYLPFEFKNVITYNSNLERMKNFETSVTVTELAVANGQLYIGGYCEESESESEVDQTCIDKVNVGKS